ncbi:hypothetical protein E2562_006940, partial [Oryza meyeriana var. granulata]
MCRWLFEAYPAVAPTSTRGKKRKRRLGEAVTASGLPRLQSPTPGEARADVLAEVDSGRDKGGSICT